MGHVLKGIGVYPALSIGKAAILERYELEDIINKALKKRITMEELRSAIEKTKEELEKIISSLSREKGGLAEIIEFQLMMLEDDSFSGKIYELTKQGMHPAQAVKEVVNEIQEMFSKMESIYMQERASDVLDLGMRILKNLVGMTEGRIEKGAIIVSEELHPSEVALYHNKVAGIITAHGTALSHFAIIARELGIPTIVNVRNALNRIKDGEIVIVNSLSGIVIVNPSKDEEAKYRKMKEDWDREMEVIIKQAKEQAITKDGTRIHVVANLGRIDEIEIAAYYGAEGVGLFRTEFLFLGRGSPPSEDEQFNAFKLAVQRLSAGSVFIRTLDIGSDKQIPYIPMPHEPNPALGKRAIRLYWKEIKDLILTQIKAILRAATYGSAGIMFPMVSDLSEIINGKDLVEMAKKELESEGKKFGDAKIGIMIETPAAALLARELAKHVDFMSIGTNDLTQYALAVDRAGIETPHFFDHLHPAVLKLIKFTIDATKDTNVELSVCGESASDVYAIPILIGLGIRKLSVAPLLVPIVKYIARLFSIDELEGLAEKALELDSPQKIRELVKEFYTKKKVSLPII